MQPLAQTDLESARKPAVDAAVLHQVLDLGGADLRDALRVQLTADFSRLRAAIADDNGVSVGRAAHELKGLAATIGATALAEMARSLDAHAQGVSAPVRAAMVVPVQAELDAVLRAIDSAGGTAQSS